MQRDVLGSIRKIGIYPIKVSEIICIIYQGNTHLINIELFFYVALGSLHNVYTLSTNNMSIRLINNSVRRYLTFSGVYYHYVVCLCNV